MSGIATPLTLVEIRIDQCPLHNPANGPAPPGATLCTATEPCANTWYTCKSKCEYTCAVRSYWFSTCRIPPAAMIGLGIYRYSAGAVESVDHLPTLACPGKTISQRGVIKVCLLAPEECNDPLQGNELQRLIAGQKYFADRTLRVYQGTCEMTDICQFTRTDWIIDRVDPPSGKPCKACFTAKDPLLIADSGTCPQDSGKRANDGRLQPFILATALDGLPDSERDVESSASDPLAAIGSFLFESNWADTPEQNLCLARTRYMQVGSEVIKVNACINETSDPGWNYTLAARGYCNSTIVKHTPGTQIKICESFEGVHVVDVWLRLITECADLLDIPLNCCDNPNQNVIDLESFEKVRCDNPLYYIDETIICSPTSLQTLREELANLFLLIETYDQDAGQIRLFSYKPPECDQEYPLIDGNYEIVKDSLKIKQGTDPYNRVIINHGVIDCAKAPSGENLSNIEVYVSADLLREQCERREYKSYRDKVINTRWLNGKSQFLAQTLAYRHFIVGQCGLTEICFQTTREIAERFDFAQYAEIRHDKLRDWAGNYRRNPWLLKGKRYVGDNDCVELCFQESAFNEIAPCLSCDPPGGPCATFFGPNTQECDSDCVRIW